MVRNGRKKAPRNTNWRYTQRKINGVVRDVKVRRINGKEQVKIISKPRSNPLNEPLPNTANVGERFERTHMVKGRQQTTIYEYTGKEGFGKWKIVSSKFL